MVPVQDAASWSSCLCCWNAGISYLHLSDLRGSQEQHCGSLCKYNPFHMPAPAKLLKDHVHCALQKAWDVFLPVPFLMSFFLPLGILALSKCAWNLNCLSLLPSEFRAPWKPTAFGLYLHLNPHLYCSCLMFWYRKIEHFPCSEGNVAAVVPDDNYSVICLWASFWLPFSTIHFHN